MYVVDVDVIRKMFDNLINSSQGDISEEELIQLRDEILREQYSAETKR